MDRSSVNPQRRTKVYHIIREQLVWKWRMARPHAGAAAYRSDMTWPRRTRSAWTPSRVRSAGRVGMSASLLIDRASRSINRRAPGCAVGCRRGFHAWTERLRRGAPSGGAPASQALLDWLGQLQAETACDEAPDDPRSFGPPPGDRHDGPPVDEPDRVAVQGVADPVSLVAHNFVVDASRLVP